MTRHVNRKNRLSIYPFQALKGKKALGRTAGRGPTSGNERFSGGYGVLLVVFPWDWLFVNIEADMFMI